MKKDNSYYQNLRPEIYEIVPKSANKILEIGCAAGGFRLNFAEQVEYWGVEPVHEAAEQAHEIAAAAGLQVNYCNVYLYVDSF